MATALFQSGRDGDVSRMNGIRSHKALTIKINEQYLIYKREEIQWLE